MTKHDTHPTNPQNLRACAEEWLSTDGRKKISQMPENDIAELIHELETHQAELEIQNEELRNAQMELAKINDQYAELYDFAPVGYLTTDLDGRICQVNRTFAALLGMPKADLVKRQVSSLVVAEDQDIYWLHRQHLSDFEVEANCELRLSINGGEAVWVRLDSVLRDDTESGANLIWSGVSNISERKESEAKQEQMQADLRHAQKMQTIGLLTAHITHEFNNLLSPILAFSDLMLMNKSDEHPDYEYLTLIKQAANSASELTSKILSYGSQSSLQFTSVQLEDVVDNVQYLIRNSMPSNVVVKSEFASNLPPVSGLFDELQQVVINLCFNASHAMTAGGEIVIRLTTIDEASSAYPQRMVQGGQVLCLSVEDSGEGMSPETLAHIFTPFYTTKDQGQGSGLGLSVTQDIVRHHDGYIDVHSRVGEGSVFSIYFPVLNSVTVRK